MFNRKIQSSFKGKYCTGCGTVWEMTTNSGMIGMVVKHPDFPSYGLERENCPTCLKAPTEAEKDTLALERHKKLLHRIADENQEMLLIKKFKKNDTK
jgi:hypothetical protein